MPILITNKKNQNKTKNINKTTTKTWTKIYEVTKTRQTKSKILKIHSHNQIITRSYRSFLFFKFPF